MTFDVLLLVLRIGFLVLLYLFLFAAVKVAWSGLARTAAARDAIRPPSSLVRLRIVSSRNGLLGQTFDLWSSATLGRAPDNTIVLPDMSVSAHHATVRHENGGWWVQDLRSTNGTAVNDVWVDDSAPLHAGDILRVGELSLRLEIDDGGPAA